MDTNAAGGTEIKKRSCVEAMVLLAPCVCDDLVEIVAYCSFWSCNVKYSYMLEYFIRIRLFLRLLITLQKHYARMCWQGYKAFE
jgi:hypothetical protein